MGTSRNNAGENAPDEIDEAEAEFLELLERDIIQNPSRLRFLVRDTDPNFRFLLDGIEIDFDFDSPNNPTISPN